MCTRELVNNTLNFAKIDYTISLYELFLIAGEEKKNVYSLLDDLEITYTSIWYLNGQNVNLTEFFESLVIKNNFVIHYSALVLG